MKKKILITGGAGFIGSHLGRELLAAGHHVRALDNLDPQVHGARERPEYLPEEIELISGDVRDPLAVSQALDEIDVVFHFAASTGVGQSMARIRDFTAVNDLGTACVLEGVVGRPVEKLIVASSMSVYGEGLYADVDGRTWPHPTRSAQALLARDWEPRDSRGRPLEARPTPEYKPIALESIYALNKYSQEQAALVVGRAYGIPTVALRLFNVYGPHQSLSNPHGGALAIFASRLLAGRAPLVFEDGQQRRDFVHVQDVARACRLALELHQANGQTFNIGSGQSYPVLEAARALAGVLGRPELEPEITGEHRMGDVRHCFADISRARRVLGYAPRIQLADGLRELGRWLSTQPAATGVAAARHQPQHSGVAL